MRGGAENQLLQLAIEQLKQGHIIDVVPLKGQLDLLEDFTRCGITVNLSAWSKPFFVQAVVIRKLYSKKDLIVHAHLPQAEIVTSLAGIKKVFCTRHYGSQFYPEKYLWLSVFLSRFATRKTVLVIAISEHVATFLRKTREVKNSTPIVTIHYGINIRNSQEILRKKESRKKSRPFIVGSLARLSPEKDLQTLVGAFEKLVKSLPPNSIELHLYGEGPLREALAHEIRHKKISESAFLKGKTSNPLEVLSQFDVFVLPSKYEGFGLVLLEAMSLEVPVVSSRIPAAIEVLGPTGKYFQVGDEIGLQQGISEILAGHRTSQAAQRERVESFDIIKTAQILSASYLKYL